MGCSDLSVSAGGQISTLAYGSCGFSHKIMIINVIKCGVNKAHSLERYMIGIQGLLGLLGNVLRFFLDVECNSIAFSEAALAYD